MKPFKAVGRTGRFVVEGDVSAHEIISFARELIAKKFCRGTALTSSDCTKDYLRLKLAEFEHEVFCVVYLDNQHQVVSIEEAFRGTIDGCAVYPREVVKRSIFHNAAAVIFAHNHPSGVAEPSGADINITQRLKTALSVIDIRVLDHLVVGGDDVVSFAERGLL